MSPEPTFYYEVIKARDETLGIDETTVVCHGRLTNDSAAKIKELVKPMIGEHGGHIVIDLGDLNYLDSSGLGALVGLKVSALKTGLCRLELANLTPRVKELLSLANLAKLFAS